MREELLAARCDHTGNRNKTDAKMMSNISNKRKRADNVSDSQPSSDKRFRYTYCATCANQF